MAVSIQIAKLKLRQYQRRASSPNLMLAKVTRYTAFQEAIHTLNVTVTRGQVASIPKSIA